MKKNIWILNHYAGHMLFDKAGRHYYIAKHLKRNGYEPVVFCANMVSRGTSKQYIETTDLYKVQMAEELEVPFVFIKTSPYQGNGFGRIRNMVNFYINLKRTALKYEKLYGKPDVIYASSVHPLTLVAGLQLAKKFDVKCICEMRDLWPEALITYSKKIRNNKLLSKLLYNAEKKIYTKADALIFTQEGGADYIRERHWDLEHGGSIDLKKAFHVNNGVDLEIFHYNLVNNQYVDADLEEENIIKIIYTGSINRINNVGILLDAAKLINNPEVKFYIFGAGNELEALKKRTVEEKINNVIFKGFVPKKCIPSIVARADINIVHWEMSPLLRVGESYNKAFEYFAAGKPVFYTVRPNYSIVEKYNCGILTKGFEASDIAEGIEYMINMKPEEKKQMSQNALLAARDYDFSVLTGKIIDIVELI